MTAFKFRLQKVLDFRLANEREQAGALLAARRKVDDARHARELLSAVVSEGQQKLAEAHGAGGPVGQLQNMSAILHHLDQHAVHADNYLRVADEALERVLAEYTEAFQERRVLDNLRARQLDQWQDSRKRDERKTMDQIAADRHLRTDNQP